MRDLRRDRLDHDAIRAPGETFGIDALLLSDLQVTEIRPKLRLGESLTSVRAHAEIQATLWTRLIHTTSGATLWTRRSTARADVASVGMTSPGRPNIQLDDLDSTRQRLVHALFQDVTTDFRPTYERRRAAHRRGLAIEPKPSACYPLIHGGGARSAHRGRVGP